MDDEETMDQMTQLFKTINVAIGAIVEHSKEYLGDADDTKHPCPKCSYEFHPIECGLYQKNYDDWLHGLTHDKGVDMKDVQEDILKQLNDIIKNVKAKQPEPTESFTDIQKKMERLSPALDAVVGIADIMDGYQKLMNEKGYEPADTLEFRMLTQISKVIKDSFGGSEQ